MIPLYLYPLLVFFGEFKDGHTPSLYCPILVFPQKLTIQLGQKFDLLLSCKDFLDITSRLRLLHRLDDDFLRGIPREKDGTDEFMLSSSVNDEFKLRSLQAAVYQP